MNDSTAGLQSDLDALTAAFEGASQRGADASLGVSGFERALEGMSGAGVIRVFEAGAQLRRRLDAMLARLGAEVATRSVPEFGVDGLAKQQGFSSASRLVEAKTGVSRGEAARLLAVGEATRARSSFAGELLAPRCAHVRGALDVGALSLDAASVIASMLKRVERRADPAALTRVEATLVELARDLPLTLLGRAVGHAEARLDPDGVEPADEELVQQRFLSMQEERSGMFRVRGLLDPVSAAPLKAVLDSMVSDVVRRRASPQSRQAPGHLVVAEPGSDSPGSDSPGSDSPGSDALGTDSLGTDALGTDSLGSGTSAMEAPVIEDRRSIPQILADSLAQVARHMLGCTAAPAPAAKTTVVVRLDLHALTSGVGVAEIDGVDRPVSAASARRLAADAEVIPMVLGGESLPLDVGRSARLFTRAQRLALAERDGGCASCGTNITYADAHHIDWWSRDRGPTDLGNGVMLCSFCHHQVHREGWGIRADRESVWFIPPPHVDPAQRPRLGGRARFGPYVRRSAA